MANCQKAGFIETWGRGINKIRQGLKKMGLPEPTIENHVSGTLITIYRNVGVNGTNNTNNVGNMSETNVGNMSETNLTERQRFILSSIKKNPLITGKEMSETLSVTQRTVERDLAAMQKAGIIRHEGKVNAGVWVVLEKPQKKRLRGMKETKYKDTEIGKIFPISCRQLVRMCTIMFQGKILSTSHRLAHSSSYPFHTYEDRGIYRSSR